MLQLHLLKKQTTGSREEDYFRRVILHVDLDCFYAQVEHNRLKIPLNVPLAVQQWNGLIAGTRYCELVSCLTLV